MADLFHNTQGKWKLLIETLITEDLLNLIIFDLSLCKHFSKMIIFKLFFMLIYFKVPIESLKFQNHLLNLFNSCSTLFDNFFSYFKNVLSSLSLNRELLLFVVILERLHGYLESIFHLL
jgi:hypothetical protein